MGQFERVAHRRAKRCIRVTNGEGRPIAGARLQLKQINHEFLFGCGAFDINEYFATEDPKRKAFLQERINIWTDLYNYGTLPFYLGQYEPIEGAPLWQSRMAAAKFLQSKGIAVKGHPLCWHTACADWLMEYDNATILDKQLRRIERDVTQFKGIIDMWDVINEVVIMPDFDKYDNAITRICKEYGRVNLIKKVFDEAKDANPEATLLLNDFNTSVAYEILIDGALQAGAPIDVIGIQSHQHQGYWGAEKLHRVLERYEQFGKPIHFTENTFVSGDLIPPHIVDLNDFQVKEWPSTPEGEERQMQQTEEMYRILFEHPLVEAVTGWDFADGMWLGAPSGVIHKDNSLKPVYRRLKELIKGEWWTETEICTDENGYAEAEGFKGDYVVQMDDCCAAFRLTDKETDIIEIKLV
ncbi:MAG: endo-1,4-beta-xylanase [Lachnospiraceae bacterium]|nr:endo-1,4-beta-xylanase [Lachnospiraceae bacterium]